MSQLIRKISFSPAYDTPNHGCHAMVIHFAVTSPEGSVVWSFHSQVYLERTRKRLVNQYLPPEPYGTEIDLHAHHHSEGMDYSSQPCRFLDRHPDGCYSKSLTGSLYGQKLAEKLLEHGDEPIWQELEQLHRENFTQQAFQL